MKTAWLKASTRFGAMTAAPAVVTSIITQNEPDTPPVNATTATPTPWSIKPMITR